jgi:predicted Zn-dependent peptidase
MPGAQSVSVGLFVCAGSKYESSADAGISHFLEHQLFRAPANVPDSQSIAEAVERVGGIINAGTGREYTYYWCKVMREHFPLALSLLAGMLLRSEFKPEDIERERQIISEEINIAHDSSINLAYMLVNELLWSGHPLSHDPTGTKETTRAISREDLVRYYREHYFPGGTVVAVAGAIEHEEVVRAANKSIGRWTGHRGHWSYRCFEATQSNRVRIARRSTPEVHVCLGLPGVSLLDPGRHTLDLLSAILGDGMSSRLFRQLRDRLGLVYGVGSSVEHLLDVGSLVISASVEPMNLKALVKAITEQLAYLKARVAEEELNKAKAMTKGHFLLDIEDSLAMAKWVGTQEILTGHILTVDEMLMCIDAITADMLQEVATRILIGDRLRLAVVGPVREDEPLHALLEV